MRIKRVVIQGFKTFATKTEFVFDPGVTAVVGPNGSGKSNIVDAVRWCLGEQSFSLLRSKKTSDVIFSGSDKKARLGMAEVSLTLDNATGEIPIDYEELEITRRAYRDGDNEYYINGQRVRLMDITEMLAQTGLGKRTYALIGQGLIDKVLSLAPEERRALFEEAAGITGYQLKRRTTLRRLEATQQNLTRVEDIVAELSPRLKYLKRQADRAHEREQIANDLRGLLRVWYGFRWHDAIAKLERFKMEEKQFAQSVKERQQALNNVAGRIDVLRSRQGQIREALGGLHGKSSGLHQAAERASRELAVARERQRQNQARREEMQRELAPLNLQQQTLATRIDETVTQVEMARTQSAQRQEEVEAMQTVLARRQAERSQLQDALDVARRALDDAIRQETDGAARLAQFAERRVQLLQDAENQRSAQEAATNSAHEHESALRKQEAERHSLTESMRALEAEVETVEPEIAELQEALTTAEQRRQGADRQVDRLQTRLDLLQRLHDEGAGYASGVRTILSAAQNGNAQLQAVRGTVASLIRVPSTLDKAIETALGGALQNVITQDWRTAQAAIEHLKQSGQGRATFLPLDRLNVLPAIPATKTSGILGNAAELVDYDETVRDAVAQLLGRVWVAEDLPAARRALDTLQRGPRPTVVTLSGEIIRPGGAVTGGSDRSRRDDSILARERELRELPAQVDQASENARQSAERCTTLVTQIEAAQLQIQQTQQQLADLRRAERQQNQQLEELRRLHDRAYQTVQWQTERLTQTNQELTRLNERERALKAQMAQLQTVQTRSAGALESAESDVAQAGVDDLLRKLADLRAAAAEAQGHLRSQQTLLENQRRTVQSVVDQIAAKEQRIVELGSESESLQELIDRLDMQEDELGTQLSSLRQEIEPAERELAGLEKNQAEEEARERTLQQLLRKDETSWNQAQLQRQRAEDTIGQLHREIEHDLGLVTLEQSDDVAYQPPLPLATFVEELPAVDELPEGLENEVREMRARLSRVSNVNPEAPREYEEAAARHGFLISQSEDLEAAARDLRKVIRELDELMEVELSRTFKAVSVQFEHFFKLLFNGGTAKLVLTEPENITETGIEIIARPPGKRPQSLALLSGGERALSACALIFAILRVSPTPFCVLDEVDAALDEANIDRFRQTVEDELSGDTQFIIVTHNRRTLEGANAIYGVTMGNDGVSKVISLRLEDDKMVQADGVRGSEVEELEDLVQM